MKKNLFFKKLFKFNVVNTFLRDVIRQYIVFDVN